jgi:hypothetical protein
MVKASRQRAPAGATALVGSAATNGLATRPSQSDKDLWNRGSEGVDLSAAGFVQIAGYVL